MYPLVTREDILLYEQLYTVTACIQMCISLIVQRDFRHPGVPFIPVQLLGN